MAVTPLNTKKIVKKITNHPNRFQSDRFDRVSVSNNVATNCGQYAEQLCELVTNPWGSFTVEILEKTQRC